MQALLNHYETTAVIVIGLLRNISFRLFIALRALWTPTAFGVAAIVRDSEGKILLVRHSYNPGWHLPGGGVGRGEPPDHAVMRELKEEVGLIGGSAIFLSLHSRKVGWVSNVVALYQIVGAQINFRPNLEIREICFVDPKEPPQGCTPATLRRLQEFQAGSPPSPHW